MSNVRSILGISGLKVASAFPSLDKAQKFKQFPKQLTRSERNFPNAMYLQKLGKKW